VTDAGAVLRRRALAIAEAVDQRAAGQRVKLGGVQVVAFEQIAPQAFVVPVQCRPARRGSCADFAIFSVGETWSPGP
jgi:hypothetical protein